MIQSGRIVVLLCLLRASTFSAETADLRSWLVNAVAFHGFSAEEAGLAVGLPAAEVEARVKEWGIVRGRLPVRGAADPLIVVPYPGGRHPRIGFLEGALDPRRETKASVFLPWSGGGYVVLDLPEAVFCDLGLIYLAHRHIPTIWDDQKVILPSEQWRRGTAGILEGMRVLPNGIVFGARITPRPDGAELEYWLRNGTDATLTKLRTQICCLLKGAAGFESQTNENKITVKRPEGEAMVVRSADGKRSIALLFERSRAWGNAPCPCLHSDPTFPDCPPGGTVKVRGRLIVAEGRDLAEELRPRDGPSSILASPILAAPEVSGIDGVAARPIRAGAAAVEIEGDDSMVIGGGIGPGKAAGQEGKLRAAAVVLGGERPELAIVACDILMVRRDILDDAAGRIEREVGILPGQLLVNATHTHHAPSTVTIHGYERDERFCGRVREAIVAAVKGAAARLSNSEPAELLFARGEERTVGQNSRLLLSDGTIYWVGPRDDAIRPTGPFDADFPLLAFRREGGSLEATLFNHSTHCIGVREAGKRSPGFYGLAAQDFEAEKGGVAIFLAGAFGSTHNLLLDGKELSARVLADLREGLARAAPRSAGILRGIRKEVSYRVRDFDEEREDGAVRRYCEKRMPAAAAESTAAIFRKMRAALAPHRGEERRTWVQAVRIGDVAFAAVPGEYFTRLGLEIKRRSPFRQTFVAGVANDYIGYIPDDEAYDLGGYQVWTGHHSLVARGTGERLAEECLKLLEALSRE